MSRSQFMVRVWIWKIWARDSRSGSPNSTLRSSRPGRSNAGSSVSGRFVAMSTCRWQCSLVYNPAGMQLHAAQGRHVQQNSNSFGLQAGLSMPGAESASTLMLPRLSKPSSWLTISSMVLCTSLSPPASNADAAQTQVCICTTRQSSYAVVRAVQADMYACSRHSSARSRSDVLCHQLQ